MCHCKLIVRSLNHIVHIFNGSSGCSNWSILLEPLISVILRFRIFKTNLVLTCKVARVRNIAHHDSFGGLISSQHCTEIVVGVGACTSRYLPYVTKFLLVLG